MPIYEYRCGACRRRFRKLVALSARAGAQPCPHCGADSSERLISRFARVRSEDESIDDLADDLEGMGDSDDPAAMRRMMREMGKQMGEDMEDDLEEAFEEEMSGEGPGLADDE